MTVRARKRSRVEKDPEFSTRRTGFTGAAFAEQIFYER
jgi:hypothetical protein